MTKIRRGTDHGLFGEFYGANTMPFRHWEEVWTGIEYQVAAHLIYEGDIAEGLTVVRAVRERYDGERRNPWNEVECGSHYARALASWSLLTALSGFEWSAPARARAWTSSAEPVVVRPDPADGLNQHKEAL